MDWDLTEALEYYKKQGAPSDQTALLALLSEVQQAHGGSIPQTLIAEIAGGLGTKEALLLALIRRIPRLRLAEQQILELCAGPNCRNASELAKTAEHLCKQKHITLKYTPCMKACGQGPNLKWNGTIYHRADKQLLNQLISK